MQRQPIQWEYGLQSRQSKPCPLRTGAKGETIQCQNIPQQRNSSTYYIIIPLQSDENPIIGLERWRNPSLTTACNVPNAFDFGNIFRRGIFQELSKIFPAVVHLEEESRGALRDVATFSLDVNPSRKPHQRFLGTNYSSIDSRTTKSLVRTKRSLFGGR